MIIMVVKIIYMTITIIFDFMIIGIIFIITEYI